jgi:uncharacterized protein YndB with AHSA1/START domain
MEVTRELVLPAPPEEVWDALTDADRLAEWFANDVELDPVRGGAGRFRWGDGEVRHAVVEELEDERLLSLRWWDEEAPEDESLVTITLQEEDEGTRVVVTESASGPQACAGFGLALELRYCLVLV